jgi:hypothetical protein
MNKLVVLLLLKITEPKSHGRLVMKCTHKPRQSAGKANFVFIINNM